MKLVQGFEDFENQDNHNGITNISSKPTILIKFEEVFYNKKFQAFRVLCIDHPVNVIKKVRFVLCN